MLPEPTLTFTLPSLHDGLPLDGRVYHPHSLLPLAGRPAPWRRHAAIVAHPYAPLGGCYDDPTVGLVAETLLRLGFLVGTFNFRGAGSSVGRTSWSAKPERCDYESFAGFVLYYTHFLDPYHDTPPPHAEGETSLHGVPILLMGGYSYGAMVTTQLPPLADILAPFAAPEAESPAAEIRLRAQHLAEQQNAMLGEALAATLRHQNGETSPRRNLAMRVGEADHHRKSHDARRSLSLEEAEEKLRRGVHDLLAKAKHKPGCKASASPAGDDTKRDEHGDEDEIRHLEPVEGLAPRRAAYLLVSPLQGVASHLTSLNFKSSSLTGWISRIGKAAKSSSSTEGGGTGHLPQQQQHQQQQQQHQQQQQQHQQRQQQHQQQQPADEGEPAEGGEQAERKLVENPTLAVFGDRDVFVAAKKLRDWAERLGKVEGSQFAGCEIATAGHFWVEEGVAAKMRDRVAVFASGLLEQQ